MKDNEWGETALIAASINGWADIVRELIAADGSVEHLRMKDNNGWTALISASRFGNTDIVRELVAADGSVEHLRMNDKYGMRALDWAKRRDQRAGHRGEINALLTAAEAA